MSQVNIRGFSHTTSDIFNSLYKLLIDRLFYVRFGQPSSAQMVRSYLKYPRRIHTIAHSLKPQIPLVFSSGNTHIGSFTKGGPFLKWAGGKKQLIPELVKHVPETYRRYIEPFVGAGALFFHLRPADAVLGDSNEELINTYKVVRDKVDLLIRRLKRYNNEERFYYEIRALDPTGLDSVERAARLIYLNKTCFNGLYRVNKKGEFNVPFGHRKDPLICDETKLRKAHEALQGVTLVSGDYKTILLEYARSGDLVYLDPPYYPSSGYADFKRYTKESFYEEDHIELRDEFSRVSKMGCHVILTNSNVDFVRRLYDGFEYRAINTKRNISSKATTRNGEDLIVLGRKVNIVADGKALTYHGNFLENFPGTRYMGSKYRVLPFIWECVRDLQFESVLDAFAGSVCVSYMFKQNYKTVISNDFMHFSYHFAKALIENSTETLNDNEVQELLKPNKRASKFIRTTFKDLYFEDYENEFLDSVRGRIEYLKNSDKKSLALAALSRACMKRRARGIFTFIGDRYNDGRRDMRIDLRQHFIENVQAFNAGVFNNGKKNTALNQDVFNLKVKADLVYLDPPYFTPNSDNDYTRRYHFVEGLVRNWEGLEIQQDTKTKKFRRYETPFISRDKIHDAFERLFERFEKSIIVLSYSSNSVPEKAELVRMLKKLKSEVRVHQVDHTYSFGNQGNKVGNMANRVKEYIFVAL